MTEIWVDADEASGDVRLRNPGVYVIEDGLKLFFVFPTHLDYPQRKQLAKLLKADPL